MSTLQTNKIQHLTSGFNNVVQFVDGAGTQNGTLCRAWVNFNGTSTVAIRGSFNVSSITDNGSGDYTVNFSNALSDGNYAISAQSSDTPTYNYVSNVNNGSLTSSSVQVVSFRTSDRSLVDATVFCVSIFR